MSGMKWQILLGFLLSVICVPWLISQVHVGQLATALQAAHYSFLLPGLLALSATYYLRVWRWYYILAPVKPLPLLRLLAAMLIALLANMVLPAHAGEVMRVYIVRRHEPLGVMAILATLVVERVADLVSILFLVLVMLGCASLPVEQLPDFPGLRLGGILIMFLGALVGVGLWLVTRYTSQVRSFLQRRGVFLPRRWLDKLVAALGNFVTGLQALQHGGYVGRIALLSLLQWVTVALNNLFIFYAFDVHLPLSAVFVVMLMEIIGVIIPSAPGFVGTYHAAVATGLAVFGVSYELALSVAIVMHATFFVPGTVVGLVFLWRESLSLRDLWTVKGAEVS
jgi:hypothetical protein